MLHSRFPLLTVLFLIATSAAMPLQAADAPQPGATSHQEREAYAHEFAQSVVTILHDPKTQYTNRQNTLRRAFVNSVDTDWIAKFVLGRAWRDATDDQRARYTALYGKFLTETYVTNFAESPAKTIYDIKVLSIVDEPQNDFVAHTRMQLMNQSDLKVDYLVNDNGGHYRVRDIVIENVSLINTHRAEFTQLAAQQGVDGVITRLEQLLKSNPQEMTLTMK